MGDLNLMNVFFDADNFLFQSDMKDFPFPSKDISEPVEETAEWFNDDTLNQMLPLMDKFFSNGDENIGIFSVNKQNFDDNADFIQKQCSSFPEKSDSNEELTDAKFMEDILFADTSLQIIPQSHKENISKCGTNLMASDETFFDAVEYVREEVIEFEEISFSSSPQSDVSVLLCDDKSDTDEGDYFINNEIMSDHSSEKLKIVYPKHVSKYQNSWTSSPAKKMKLTEKLENKKMQRIVKKSADVDSSHPRLQLTSEEKKIASKEGIELPSHYPLTKEQQRQLKRIRRKIRNKISAQHSRRRKQEYVDGLEQRLKRNSEDRVRLMDRIKCLENEKSTMATKISKLQTALARFSGQMAPPTSCLLVLIMSLALILAPSLKNSSLMNENVGANDISMFDEQSSSPMNCGRSSSRNLLFSQNSSENQSEAKEEFKMITDLLEKIRFSNSNVLFEFLDLLRIKFKEKESSWKNRNYFKTIKQEHFEPSKKIETSELLPNKFDDSENKTGDIKLQKPVAINWHVV